MAEQPLRVLVIENNEIDRRIVQGTLGQSYEILEAETGQQGLALVEQDNIDCVLLDHHLPDMDGMDVLSRLVQYDLAVILLSSKEEPSVIVESMKRGAQDYLLKRNMSQSSLERAIGNAVEKNRLRHELETQRERLVGQHQKIRELASKLTLAEQRERRRIAQILHDNLQQTLHGIHVQRHVIEIQSPAELKSVIQEPLDLMATLIDRSIETARSLSVELSPPVIKDENLNLAFEWLAQHMGRVNELNIDLDFEVDCRVRDEDLRVLIFQLVRELLFNVVKHAGTREAHLHVCQRGDELFIQISDSGQGFDLASLFDETQEGFGLYSVRERLELFDGRLDLDSAPGEGTRAAIVIPKESNGLSVLQPEEAENYECD